MNNITLVLTDKQENDQFLAQQFKRTIAKIRQMGVCYAFMLVLRGIQLILKASQKESITTNLIEVTLLGTTIFVFLIFWVLTRYKP
jgi:hypothetical protein